MKLVKLLFVIFISTASQAQQVCPIDTAFPFTTDSVHLKIWNKTEYIPFFLKGCNLGAAVPGTFPGQLAVSRAQYSRWFSLIKEAGFNCIRLYTLHYPRFYEVLDSFNLANPKNPLYFFQGVWLEEELPNYNNDLYFLGNFFQNEIEENVDCVHGNRVINQRFGKAYGSYTVNCSRWNMGYIIGRETFPEELLKTNQTHPNDTIYNGPYFSINGTPSETYITGKLDHLVNYEYQNYHTQRPVSYSSWPTLDPLRHPKEISKMEDTVSIDLNTIDHHLARAGYFASYHAYPYYPDFVGSDSLYETYSDNIGPNSYYGYLTALKQHYTRIPLLIAETGVPSSRGIAHYATSGMNHGGADEQKQGETMLRLFHNVKDAGCAGAFDFSFIDEWFKSTWITAPLDYNPEARILWHNVMSPEQNYGLIGFQRPWVYQNWATYAPSQPITEINAAADYDYFHLKLKLGETMQSLDDIWIAFDTYSAALGESVLPTGDTIQNRAEFFLHINNFSAQLYVTQAYDIYGIWGNTSTANQLFRSVPTNGAPWLIERWKTNNAANLLQYVGNLSVQNNFSPPSSMDAVKIYHDSVTIRIPWSLLHFVEPNSMRVFNDQKSTPLPEDTISDGIQITAFYHNQIAIPPNRYTWPTWNVVNDVVEFKKGSFNILKNGLNAFNVSAIPISDTYLGVDSFPFNVAPANGLLKNDFDLDGTNFQALLIGNAQHGLVSLNSDGSYTYNASAGYVGQDYFEYCLFDGLSISQSAFVCLDVDNSIGIKEVKSNAVAITIFPNPAKDLINLRCAKEMSNLSLFDASGKLVKKFDAMGQEMSLNIQDLSTGIYYLKSTVEDKSTINRISISK